MDHQKTIINILTNNIGNRITTELGSGLADVFSKLVIAAVDEQKNIGAHQQKEAVRIEQDLRAQLSKAIVDNEYLTQTIVKLEDSLKESEERIQKLETMEAKKDHVLRKTSSVHKR